MAALLLYFVCSTRRPAARRPKNSSNQPTNQPANTGCGKSESVRSKGKARMPEFCRALCTTHLHPPTHSLTNTVGRNNVPTRSLSHAHTHARTPTHARGLRLTSPGGSSDGTEINSLSARSRSSEAGGGEIMDTNGPPFSGGRMLDVSEAEEMNAAIKQLYLKTPSGATPFVLFKARLRTSRREWNIERRYSDFVWLHEVGGVFLACLRRACLRSCMGVTFVLIGLIGWLTTVVFESTFQVLMVSRSERFAA